MSDLENPPAFPVLEQHRIDGSIVGSRDGMTLRDYFAGQALVGAIARPGVEWGENPCATVARDAYSIADAMLKARQAGKDGE